jgi:thiol:disulfide interchange protein
MGLHKKALQILGLLLYAVAIVLVWITTETTIHPAALDILTILFLVIGLVVVGHSMLVQRG